MTVSLDMMPYNADSRPRQLVYSKMERLITTMNDQKTGIPLKDKKNFLTTLPSSFTGYDFINWLSDRMCEGNTTEAMHIASFLCLYGYIYPIDVKSFSVKEEKNIHYRFQSPHHWPSKNLKLTNEKYIIYLLKRSKRNKKKHGLEEYEQMKQALVKHFFLVVHFTQKSAVLISIIDGGPKCRIYSFISSPEYEVLKNALSKLQLVFCDKLGFCTSQAEEQVRQVKLMKRDDKFVHDLQERAFWKVHRPPPNQICHVEEGPSRYFQPSQIMARKKKNKDLKIKEVEYFRRALLRPRMKFSESLKIFMQRLEQYLEFDPLLDTLSNPWISEDETIWDINRDNIEVPTVMRIRKWGLNFEELLQDSRGWSEFEMFLKKEYSQENILFYEACKKLVSCPIKEVLNRKQKIEKEYLTAGAQGEVNIDCKTLEIVIKNLKTENSQNNRYVFQPAMDHVYALMKKDCYSRFLRSDQYKDLLQTAQSHYSKKRFLSFGSNRKKNTVTASPQPRRRGSTSSDNALGGEGDISGPSYHSYSTGNLRELDEKPKKSIRQSNSPSVRRKVDETDKNANKEKDIRRRSNLDVPRSSGYSSGSNETNRKSEAMSQCLALNVPKSNVVTPWEGE